MHQGIIPPTRAGAEKDRISANPKQKPYDRIPMPAPRLLLTIFGLLAAAACIGAAMPPAADCLDMTGQVTTAGRWRVTADRIVYDAERQVYTATGNVVIVHGQKRLAADRVVLDRKTMAAEATGNVALSAGGDRMSGRRLEINLETATGSLYHGLVFIEENNFRIRGDRIEKTGPSTYHIRNGALTTCQGPVPNWRITGKNVDVTVEGYGSVSRAAFWVRQWPVLYLPWFLFPAKLERQTGLLTPRAAYSSRNGAEFIQPFFWAISENSDATLYYHHIGQRGEKFGLEYRYVLAENAKGILMADGFEDERIDDGTPEATEKWGYSGDTAIRPNTDRYWFRMKADQPLPWDAKARLDLDVVSDQDYLREFSGGYTGYEPTREAFVSEFGRDLDDENDPVRTNRLNINRTGMYQAFNADLVWYDNVIKRRLSDTDDTLQRLPAIESNLLKQPVAPGLAGGGNLLFASLDSRYTYFYRQEGTAGHRVDLHPRLYLPLRVEPYFTFEPSAGLRQTAWYIDADRRYYAEGRDRYMHRELYDIGAQLSTDLHRVFAVDKGGIEKIRHLVIPALSYGYVPDTDQSEYPDFDGIDRIEGQNRLALSFTHLFTSKRKAAGPPGGEGEAGYTYNRFCRFFIEQAYDFNRTSDPEAAWQPLYAELDLTPEDLVTLHADAEWSHAADTLASGNLSLRIRDRRGDRLRVDYRYSRDFHKSLFVSASTPITDRLTIFGQYERNLKTDKDIGKGLGTRYESGCWAVEAAWEDEADDRRYMILVDLYGLGEFGNSL